MSAPNYNEEQRPILAKLDGKGPYIVTRLTIKEQISDSSNFTATLVSKEKLSAKMLGKVLDIQYSAGIEGDRVKSRRFFALISSLENLDFSINKQLYTYRVEAIDPLSIFAYRTTSRSFQDMTTKQIIEKVISDSGLKSHFKLSPRNAGTKHSYCIQFNENDLSFIKRLLAYEGWHYHCDHSGSQPSIVVADSNQDFAKAANDKVPFITQASNKTYTISQWHYRSQLGTSKLSLADHNEELAECLSSGERNTTTTIKNNALSQYFFGQGNTAKSAIRDAAKRQMESLDCQKVVINAASAIPSLGAGLRFSLIDHTESDYNQEYVITQAEHYFEATENSFDVEYKNSFQCIPASTPWRPAFIDKPSIHSIQSAEVTGPSGEEVNQDKFGRIKVHFHWDKDGKKDENSSCWIPVAQPTASNGFGIQFIPRIGDEVLISFIDGDPDRPVISGSIYNGKNKPPYSTATQSGIKTRTTPNGSSNTANELRFEDKKDKEEVFLQAEKDLTINVKNDLNQTVKGKANLDVEKAVSWTSKEAMSFNTEDQFSATAKKDLIVKSDATISSTAGKNAEISASSKIIVDGQSIDLKGKTKIKLSVGGSSIELSQSGIKISGTQISIKGQAKAEMKAAMIAIQSQAKTDVKGALVEINGSAMTQVKAGAMVQVQGAIAKVN
ncbi:type VI secretion system tip protein VgrG [Photobacterium sp. SDRW27]|uniref:type VI secretion system Vgr family protein n=1 Tax=Photobacterium obscurum TaxID=2829490 RepID=UPI0022445AD9|nr:type VI secretion system tip protein TssI/VgrG [Photobacterium obscurum]MCW8327859.1 type VI secretion system tip protein VgrG [Photobacterium obscurum]